MKTRNIPKLIGAVFVFVVVLALIAAAIETRAKHNQEIDSVSNELKLARTLQIIRTSTPANPKVLKVLFYGQSITRSGWVDLTVAHWRQKYPNTVFDVQNRALGGFPSQALVRTVDQDLAAFYPDLIVFHVYGDHHAYEKIVRDFRSETAADVILQTDHAEVMPDPPCNEGLHLSLHRPPGCKGFIWVKQREWSDEMSYHTIPAYAKKYGVAIEPQRGWWRDYLLRTHIDPKSMLRDAIHPNAKGVALYAQFFDDYFDNIVDRYNVQTENNVVAVPLQKDAVHFAGTRLELITSEPLASFPTVTIDGVSPASLDSCYLVNRASPTPTVPDWPVIRRITLIHDRNPAQWQATLTNISPDQKNFDFTVKSGSSQTDEGSGNSSHDFTAKSGLLKIESQDWMIEPAFEESRQPIQGPLKVTWSVSNLCDGTPEVIDLDTEGLNNGAKQYRYVLATGLPNREHIVRLNSPLQNLPDDVEFRSYNPPLK